jgi:amidohydrolase
MAKLAADSAAEVEAACGGQVITSVQDPTMVAEDFALYLEEAPGAFLFLSSANEEKGCAYPHHNSRFDVDEDVLWKGASVFAAIAERLNGI